jgi:hypothetical protein
VHPQPARWATTKEYAVTATQPALFPDDEVIGTGTRRPWAELAAEQEADPNTPSAFDVPLFPVEDVQS